MLHAPVLSRSISVPTLSPDDRPPVTPAAYVRLRRNAADVTVVEAAERMAVKADDLAEARALLRMLETPGVVARSLSTIVRLRQAFPIDALVYHQLATEPADRHPQICRGCGCSEHDACMREDLGACSWAGANVCTRCTDGERF